MDLRPLPVKLRHAPRVRDPAMVHFAGYTAAEEANGLRNQSRNHVRHWGRTSRRLERRRLPIVRDFKSVRFSNAPHLCFSLNARPIRQYIEQIGISVRPAPNGVVLHISQERFSRTESLTLKLSIQHN